VVVLKFSASTIQNMGFEVNKNLVSDSPYVGLIFFTDLLFAKRVNLILNQVLISSDGEALNFCGIKWSLQSSHS